LLIATGLVCQSKSRKQNKQGLKNWQLEYKRSLAEKKSLVAKCAATTLSSKLIGGEKEFFASLVVAGGSYS